MEAELGGAPDGKRVTTPLIRICFSVGSRFPSLSESAQTLQSLPFCLICRVTGVFRRTASNRVNFSMSDKRAAASFSWYVRNERMRLGIAIAVRIRSTVRETPNSTMLKPAMRLRRVRGFGALLCKVVSSFKRQDQRSSLQGRLRDQFDAVAIPGTAGRNCR